MNILVVDDELDLLESLKRGLKKSGYGVYLALSADKAFYLLDQKKGHIDLIITDFMLPGENGIEFIKKIRLMGYSLPVILMSACTTTDLLKAIDSNIYNSFMRKPFTFLELKTEINRYL